MGARADRGGRALGQTLRRPGLRAALAACRSGDAEGIAVARLDRLTYSLADLAELVREAVGGYTIVSLQPAVDIAIDEAGGGGGARRGGIVAAAGDRVREARPHGPAGAASTRQAPVAERIRGLGPGAHDPAGNLRRPQPRGRADAARGQRVAIHIAAGGAAAIAGGPTSGADRERRS